jgi:predicted MPP superfamily phosphohydrolase
VLLLGGDCVSLRAEYAHDLVNRLASIPATLGRYAVLSNRDYWRMAVLTCAIRDSRAAATPKAYRRAIDGDHTTEYGRDEARYHLAIALVDPNAKAGLTSRCT